jgi:hypothetical protein
MIEEIDYLIKVWLASKDDVSTRELAEKILDKVAEKLTEEIKHILKTQ